MLKEEKILTANIGAEKWEAFLKDLERGICGFEDAFPLEEFRLSSYRQQPWITLLTCSDARVPGTMVGKLFNRVFCVENIGNQFKTSEGSILYGLLHLRTPLMLVAGHSDCGAIKAAATDFSSEPLPLRKELETVKASIDEVTREVQLGNAENSPHWHTELAELNVDQQIAYLLDNSFVADKVNRGELLIIGIILDLHNIYNGGYGRIYTINVNGNFNPVSDSDYRGKELIIRRSKRISRI